MNILFILAPKKFQDWKLVHFLNQFTEILLSKLKSWFIICTLSSGKWYRTASHGQHWSLALSHILRLQANCKAKHFSCHFTFGKLLQPTIQNATFLTFASIQLKGCRSIGRIRLGIWLRSQWNIWQRYWFSVLFCVKQVWWLGLH